MFLLLILLRCCLPECIWPDARLYAVMIIIIVIITYVYILLLGYIDIFFFCFLNMERFSM